ncbi:hypothetical protein ABVK25_006103 [Lepraria finkii]|uniref:Uncharacterized protein n=1 Tax=Lepraria finkii TaxID=1340010 RepID=A0ABR4B6H1_9LECA
MLDARAVRQVEGGHSGARGAFNGPAKGAVLKVGGESVRWGAVGEEPAKKGFGVMVGNDGAHGL